MIIRTVGMATNKVAMEMMVLKWMQRGLLSQLDSTNHILLLLQQYELIIINYDTILHMMT